MPKPVAVVLCGCGRADGTEITEAVSCLVHLDRHGLKYACFAPDKPQADVINHATGQPVGESRNCMVEAARISRGDIRPLRSMDVDAFAALLLPGGYGAAKNLCTFAKEGASCSVDPDVERVFRGFHAAGKPIGLVCIAPVIAAKVLGTAAGGPGCEITVGPDAGAAAAVAAMGSRTTPRPVTDIVFDARNRLVSTPAYMCDATPHGVFVGIGKLVDALADQMAR